MNNWKKLGIAGLAVGALAFAAARADAVCIDNGTHTVSNPADCSFAAGGSQGNCRLAVAVDMDGAGAKPLDVKKITCVDGDPLCDADGSVNGSCTFRVGVCVNPQNPSCDTDSVSAGSVDKPSTKDASNAFKLPSAYPNRFTLEDAFSALLPSATNSCTASDLPVKVDLKAAGGTCQGMSDLGEKCASDLDCMADDEDYCMPAFKKNKANVAISVDDSGSGASVKFKLNCTPAVVGPNAHAAKAFQITNANDLIGGPLAMGRLNDFTIRNGNVRAVVRKPGRQHSFTLLEGGQIIDADLVRKNPADDRDSWQGIQPLINISSTQGTDTVTVTNDGSNGAAAILTSSGDDDLFDVIKPNILVLAAGPLSVPSDADDVDIPVHIKTNLILNPYSNMIQMATTVTNNGATTAKYIVGDYVNPSGQLEPFGPGQGYGETQIRNGSNGTSGQSLDYLAFQGRLDADGVTYGVIFGPSNVLARTVGNTGAFASSGVYAWAGTNLFNTLFANMNAKPAGPFQIAAGGSNTYRRWFTVGTTVSDVTKARTELFGGDKGALQGFVNFSDGSPAAEAHVTLINGNINNKAGCMAQDPTLASCVNIYSSTLTDSHGFYRFVAPPGDYQILVRKKGAPYEGLHSTPTQNPVTLAAKKTAALSIVLPNTGTVTVNVLDGSMQPVAAKISVVGVPASPDPMNDEYLVLTQKYTGRYFGYDFEEKGDIFGLAAYHFADASGSASFNLEPGTYHVVVSHGYEYDVYDQVITVTGDTVTPVNATVHHVVDTSGFVSIDTHVHMIQSPDSTISVQRRIISMLAEGVDFFVNTDHDFVHDLGPTITAMGVGNKIANRASVETTTSHYGHFNMWPINVDASQVAGGAPDWSAHLGVGPGYPSGGAYDSEPGEIFASGIADGAQVIQINHFNSGTLGHFNMLGIDTDQNPPVSSNKVYRCVGGSSAPASPPGAFGLPCHVAICIGGGNDSNTCTGPGDCPGGTCSAATSCPGGTCMPAGNLSAFLRMDPTSTNLYSDNYTALELWIEAGRGQTSLLLGENFGDWFNLLNQGRYKAGTADSDSHSTFSVQAGGPRTFVASSTDDPASIDANELAQNVNKMRAIGSNGPFMRVSLQNGAAQVASHAVGQPRTVVSSGAGDQVNIHVEAPTWAEYDTIDIYQNTVPSCLSQWTFFGVVNPSSCTVAPQITLHKGTDFSVTPSSFGGGTRQTTDISVPLTVTTDSWIVVVVRGTDGVSHPLFPMEPEDLDQAGNDTLAGLTDMGGPPPWNLNEHGVLALAYSNPLFFDRNSDGFCVGGASCPGL
ncbi:MAG TPA: hypothetical protein VGK20_14920 [Candidatus Binatia bacterium]|jgi:hypothetical protein